MRIPSRGFSHHRCYFHDPSLEGFKNGANITTEYTYDQNGNMLTDANKGITGIVYNHLNLPTQVTIAGQNISYIYDAVGTKLRKTVSGITTDYAGNYVYENSTLQFFNTAEGYVEPNGTGWQYVYQYRDHLGNVRLSYADADGNGIIAQTEIREENNYYPFGLKHKGYNFVVNGRDHRYGFGNKEEQDELGLGWIDITARNYDPALGRWMNVDPLAEAMRRHSPYNYAFNNPLRFTDPDGMGPDEVIITGNKSQEAFNQLQSSVSSELALSIDDKGKVTYNQVDPDAKLSADAQQLVTAIDDNSTIVNVNASDSQLTSKGNLFVGGAFMGNEISNSGELAETGNTIVTANQEVNPDVLGAADDYNGTPGSLILHEVTEAYQGAQITKETQSAAGVATLADASNPKSTYSRAHKAATRQKMDITQTVYDAKGNVLQGTYTGAAKVEYSVQSGNRPKKVIMTFPNNK